MSLSCIFLLPPPRGILDNSVWTCVRHFCSSVTDLEKWLSLLSARRSMNSFVTFTGRIIFSLLCRSAFAFLNQQGSQRTFPTYHHIPKQYSPKLNEVHCRRFWLTVSTLSQNDTNLSESWKNKFTVAGRNDCTMTGTDISLHPFHGMFTHKSSTEAGSTVQLLITHIFGLINQHCTCDVSVKPPLSICC